MDPAVSAIVSLHLTRRIYEHRPCEDYQLSRLYISSDLTGSNATQGLRAMPCGNRRILLPITLIETESALISARYPVIEYLNYCRCSDRVFAGLEY